MSYIAVAAGTLWDNTHEVRGSVRPWPMEDSLCMPYIAVAANTLCVKGKHERTCVAGPG